MNRTEQRQLVLIALALAVGIAIGAGLFFRTVTAESLRVPFTVTADGSPKLYLKSIGPGGTGAKVVALENTGPRTVVMHLIPAGAYADWLAPDRRWVVVKPGTQRAVVVWVHVPEHAEAGGYEGAIDVVSYGVRS